jgi:hypothetical protein
VDKWAASDTVGGSVSTLDIGAQTTSTGGPRCSLLPLRYALGVAVGHDPTIHGKPATL